jgi:hypothetical protein
MSLWLEIPLELAAAMLAGWYVASWLLTRQW